MSCISSASLHSIESVPEDGPVPTEAPDNWGHETSTAKYGDLSPLGVTSNRKVNSFPSTFRRPKRCSENWDGDFELDGPTDFKIPTLVQTSSHALDIDLRNIRSLSQKTIVLKEILDEVRRKATVAPERASDNIGQEYAPIIDEADAMVKLVNEVSDLRSQKAESLNSSTPLVDEVRLINCILTRTRPPSPITPDGSSVRSVASAPATVAPFHFTADLVPPLLDQVDELIIKLTSFSRHLQS